MDLQERCWQKIFETKTHFIEGRPVDSCYGCDYDIINNPKCSYYFPLKIMILEVDEKN